MILKVLLISFFVFSNYIIAQVKLDSVFNAFRKDKALQFSSISFLVKDLDTDSTLLSFNDSILNIPASTVKLFSTASAFEILGKDYRPKTNFYIDKFPDTSGVVESNIFIKGAADISFASQYFSTNQDKALLQIVDTLKKSGIKVIRGNFVGDSRAFGYNGAPDGWSWGDLGNYYGAFPSGLSIYDNTVKFQFYVGVSGTKPILVSTYPEIPNLVLKNHLLAANGVGDNSRIYGSPYSYERSIHGSLSANNKTFKVLGSLPDPELQFLQDLKLKCENNGIIIDGNVISCRSYKDTSLIDYKKKKNIYTHLGAPVKEVAYWTNLKSLNVFAESLASWVGYEKSGCGTTEYSIKLIQDFWKDKIYVGGLNLTDGSGLSRTNRVSARTFYSLLKYMYYSKNKDEFINTLPVIGKTGTLETLCKGQCSQGNIQAKSGTMKGVKSYAGYVTTQSGKKLAFAIIVNNFSCGNNAIMKKLEPLMNAMYLQ